MYFSTPPTINILRIKMKIKKLLALLTLTSLFNHKLPSLKNQGNGAIAK
ncbi:secreted protein [methanotrophic bacterial endosymbiont of Bathymodiolus sp.]|nr:secreted protein [methanotrophic bacterial endosymbiont of Bathymodiolus sp.]